MTALKVRRDTTQGYSHLRIRRRKPLHIVNTNMLNSRWYELRPHLEQSRSMSSRSRFNIIHSGRRSGKTEIYGKRKLVIKAMIGSTYIGGGRYFASAPTRDQAKRIFWQDLKRLVPDQMIAGKPLETDLMIPLVNGSQVWVLGLDKPERLEGSPWDHGVIDEIGNTKPETWEMHVRPALADRNGTCDFIGVPEGRNHYYDLYKKALEHIKRAKNLGTIPRWNAFHWLSSEILDADEIAEAKEDMDELTFQQEYEGSFLYFSGRAYYNYIEQNEESCREYYDTDQDLILAFDFNKQPGVCSIIQEMQEYEHGLPVVGKTITGCMDEVYIKRNSTTEKVCSRIISKYGNHQGRIFCYGDASGGAGGSAKVKGSDWDIVARELRNHYGYNRIFFRIPRANPSERTRINSVNSRLLNMSNDVYLLVDPIHAPMTAKDFEGVRLVDDGSGKIDKDKDKMLSHLTDAIGYYVDFEYPTGERRSTKLLRV